MTDEKFIRMSEYLSERTLTVTVDLYTWISVLGMLQLALRHPGVQGSVTAVTVEHFGRALESKLGEVCPEATEIMAQGWNPIYDEPIY